LGVILRTSTNKKYYINEYDYNSSDYFEELQFAQVKRRRTSRKQKPKKAGINLFAFFFCFLILSTYSYYVCPYTYKKFFKPLVLNPILNRNIKLDAKNFTYPTAQYINNTFLIDRYMFSKTLEKSKAMSDIQIIAEMTETKDKVLKLAQNYSLLKPSVFVWEYSTGSGFEINADEVYPSASIIKIPIAVELLRLVDKTSETNNPIRLTDKRVFSEQYRTEGSGDLQRTRANVSYTLDYLANIMIANSDNSATNMILNEIGGINEFNRAMRNYGLKVTSMGNWLPDLEGTNVTTAREMSRILYNIDNSHYVNPKLKHILKEYLGNTKNIHLIKEKLPSSAMVLHKTGDIGEMLGDSGIVYADNGKKYIITIMVKRPHNNYAAKLLIQDISALVYEDIKRL